MADNGLRAEWLAACDAYELAQDTGKSDAEMKALEEACLATYAAMTGAA